MKCDTCWFDNYFYYRGCHQYYISGSWYPNGPFKKRTVEISLHDARNKDCFNIPTDYFELNGFHLQYLQFSVASYYGESASLQYMALDAEAIGKRLK